MKQRMNLKPLLTFALLIGLIACVKQASEGDSVIFIYPQSQCMDKWGYGSTDELTAQKIHRYLDSAGLAGRIVRVGLTGRAAEAACLACSCPTGKTIFVKVQAPVSAVLSDTLQHLGFSRQ